MELAVEVVESSEVVSVVVETEVDVVEELDPLVVDEDPSVVEVDDVAVVVVVDEAEVEVGLDVGVVVDRTVGGAVVATRRRTVVTVDDVVDSTEVVDWSGSRPPEPAPVDDDDSISDVSVLPPAAGAAGNGLSATTLARLVASGFGTTLTATSSTRTRTPTKPAAEGQNQRRSVISLRAVASAPRRRSSPGTRTLLFGATGAGTALGNSAAGYG